MLLQNRLSLKAFRNKSLSSAKLLEQSGSRSGVECCFGARFQANCLNPARALCHGFYSG